MAVDKAEYDIEAYAEKVRKVLKEMQESAAPGERTGKGRRMDVMRAVKADIQGLVAMGYTAGQISDAISKGDVFKILPKNITQMLNESDRSARTGPTSAKKAGTSTGMSQKRTPGVRDTVTKNKPPTSDNGVLAAMADVKEPNKPAPEVRQAQAGGRTGPRPDRD